MSEVLISNPAEFDIVCMAKVTFDPISRHWLHATSRTEDDKDVLAGSRFDCDVKNKAGEIILEFSTEVAPGGLTIQNVNEIQWLKTAAQMNIAPGVYTFNMQRTVAGIVRPWAKGNFIVQPNNNQVPA